MPLGFQSFAYVAYVKVDRCDVKSLYYTIWRKSAHSTLRTLPALNTVQQPSTLLDEQKFKVAHTAKGVRN